MPTYSLPQSGQRDLTIGANFRERSHRDLGMIAKFNNPFTTTTVPMSAYFRQKSFISLPTSANFRRASTNTLAISAIFANPKRIASLPLTVRFYAGHSTANLTTNALFKSATSIKISASFRKATFATFPFSANFDRASVLPMSAQFRLRGSNTLRMRAFLGHFNSDLAMTATFSASGFQNFSASIIIQNHVAPKTVFISGTRDLAMQTNFTGKSAQNFLMQVLFGGALPNDFKAKLQVVNPYFGVGGATVGAMPTGGAMMGIQPITVQSDSTGFFHIGNLLPGSYLITPVYNGLTFMPPSINVTLSNQNVTLYFHADGSFANSTLTALPLPANPTGGCIINANTDTPGTLSIDGIILPADYMKDYPSVIVTAHSEEEAAKFRQTFNINIGGGY